MNSRVAICLRCYKSKISHLADVPVLHRGLGWGMDGIRQQSLLGNGYYLDLVNNFGWIVLCRDDGTEVVKFTVWDATSEAIERAAREDQSKNQQA
jgi:hypothetical protein